MSNETLKPNPAKTKSAPKLLIVGLVLVCVAAVLAVTLPRIYQAQQPTAGTTLTVGTGSKASKTYKLETVTTEQDQTKGLSGRQALQEGSGMHFKYEATAERCIWMKDMRFSIDVIWVDNRNRIVSAVQNMSPSSYPQKYCAQAVSVIELPAGTIREQGLRTGQLVDL